MNPGKASQQASPDSLFQILGSLVREYFPLVLEVLE
jgi:hypothetical protein